MSVLFDLHNLIDGRAENLVWKHGCFAKTRCDSQNCAACGDTRFTATIQVA